MLEEKSLNPRWIASKDCLVRKIDCNDFYVLPTFKGEVFKRLVSLKCRIYGVLALVTCLKRKERLPKRHSPIWSTSLQGSIVCFSGIEIKSRKQQILLVKMMGGTISKAFTKKITHLIADSQDTKSKKFVTAIDYAVPVLSSSWIFTAWKKAKALSEEKYTDEQFVNEHKLQIFSKCVISCSGLAPEDRSTLSRLIEANGGIYTGNMKKNYCTHLVTDLNSGEKYKIARKWCWDQIMIVRLRWVTKSVEKGYRLPERLYETNSTTECSTSRASQLTQSQPLTNVEISVVGSSTGQQRTIESDGPLSNDVPEKSESTITEMNKPTTTRSNWLKAKAPQRTTTELDPIVVFDLDAIRFNDFMSSCIIYLCGIEDENLKKYKWLTNKVGSGRRDRLVYTDTTHVLVGLQRLDWELIKQLKEKAYSGVKVVTCGWLLDCAKAQKVLDESNYLIFKQERSDFEISQRVSSAIAVKGFHCIDEAKKKTILKITEIGTRLLGKAAGMLSSAELNSVETSTLERPRIIGNERSSGGRHLFIGLSFRIIVSKEENRAKLFSDIECHGGKVEPKTEIWVDYMVCEVLDFLLNDSAANFNCGSLVSSFWLLKCLEKSMVLDVEKHPLYRPIQAFETSQIFDGHVVGLRSLPKSENEIFTDILYKFGADVRSNVELIKQLNGCTEIVIWAETECTDFERQWQAPVLDPSWIIESVIQNQLQPVPPHLFHDQPFKNYTRNDRLWMHAAQRKSSNNRFNKLNGISNNDELLIRRSLNENKMEAIHQFCETDVWKNNLVQKSEHTTAEDRMFKNLDQNVLGDKNEQTSNYLAATLDLAEAFAYVDGMSTQIRLVTSRDETWNETAVGHAIGEAVVKTAQASRGSWTSSMKGANDYNLMQTRQNKRNNQPTSLIEIVESPKKAKVTNYENCEAVISKDEKKRRIAEKLAKLAIQRDQLRSVEAEKRKREQEAKAKAERQDRVESPKPRASKRNVKPPEPEYYGWKESSPRPIATQILNPFESDQEEEDDEKTFMPTETEETNQGNQKRTTGEYENTVMVKKPGKLNKAVCFTSTMRYDRNVLVNMVLELDGEVCHEFSEKVTHLVCGRLVRNEKLLCAIAKGLVIVDEDYVVDSHAQSKWLEIDNYEWGSTHSMIKHNMHSSHRFFSFALACTRWRAEIKTRKTKRAFHEWRALLYCGRRRFADLKRIIRFGGGEAFLRDDVCSLKGFTVALVEKSEFWNSEEVVELIKNNVQCFGIDYLAAYLTIISDCEIQKYYHKDYVTELNRIPPEQLLSFV